VSFRFWFASLGTAGALAAATPTCAPAGDEGSSDGPADAAREDGAGSDAAGDGAEDAPYEVRADDSGGDACGATAFDVLRVIPDVLILLDRSNSMMREPPTPPLWDTIRAAIGDVTTPPRDATVWFGLMTFPSMSCGRLNECPAPDPGDLLVDVGRDRHGAIADALAALEVCGATTTAATLEAARARLEGIADGHPKYVLLATDGAPNCNAGLVGDACAVCMRDDGQCGLIPESCLDDARTYGALDTLCAAGIPTWVLGLGAASDYAWVMENMASHGCTEHAFAADAPGDVAAALEAIARQVESCRFEMSCADIPDRDRVNFFSEPGHGRIPRDAGRTSGWDWVDPCGAGDASGAVEFFGDDCVRIRAGEFDRIGAEFGCPTVLL